MKKTGQNSKVTVKKSVSGAHFGKNLSLGKMAVMSELAILDAKTIAPEGKKSDRLLCWLVVDPIYTV